jgi:predicted outer membrane lipoprotein
MPGAFWNRFERLERDALMEWILVRRRLLALLVVVLGLVLAAAVGIFYAVGVSHLNKQELQHFGHQQRLLRTHSPYQEGLIHERVPPE